MNRAIAPANMLVTWVRMFVAPAKAGAQDWIPAFAGMTPLVFTGMMPAFAGSTSESPSEH